MGIPTLPLKAAYTFGYAHGLEREINEIREMDIEWDLSYDTSLRRGYIVDLLQKHSLFEEFKAQHWPVGNTTDGVKKTKFYLNLKSRYESGKGPEPPSPSGDADGDEGDQAFAAEADLRDFLAKNPNCIEPGLRIYENEGTKGIEFAIDDGGGRIDLLFLDRNNKFVVVELKVGRGRNKTVGQLLYYMGWVDLHLGHGPCRGMIIAKDISEDLITAVRRVPGVTLFNYKLSVTLEVLKDNMASATTA